MISWKAPPLIDISNTPPSNVLSRSKLFAKETLAPEPGTKEGVVICLSVMKAGSSMKRALGAETTGGAGVPEVEVTQSAPPPTGLLASHPDGKAGATTASK